MRDHCCIDRHADGWPWRRANLRGPGDHNGLETTGGLEHHEVGHQLLEVGDEIVSPTSACDDETWTCWPFRPPAHLATASPPSFFACGILRAFTLTSTMLPLDQ